MLSLIPRWFEDVAPSQDYRRSDYLFLLSILAIGAFFRFWGLDNVGLHGDEETMAMPAMAILESGQPILPSGMYYARALINVYLMSGSALIFGESEWAFRLPSAVVGSLTGLAAFFMGRRFLAPQVNLAFVAAITLLPSMIAVSQTARMYVFFVTCMIWFAACLFRWERDQRASSLVLAILVWLLCLHFHKLAIFAAPLFLFPGLSRQSWAQFLNGCAAFVVCLISFSLYDHWISQKYPKGPERPPSVEVDSAQAAIDLFATGKLPLLIGSALVVVALAVFLVVSSGGKSDRSQAIPALFLGFGLLGMTVLQYHIGIILLIVGIVFWLRSPNLPRFGLVGAIVVACLLAVSHLYILHDSGLYPGRKIIGALVGTPSVWPIFRFLEYSPIAGALYGLVLLYAVAVFSMGRRFPMHLLFFAMAVWAPLLILGFFAWNIPPRYAQGHIGFFLMCAFAGLAYLWSDLGRVRETSRLSHRQVAALALAAIAIINPLAFGRAINPSYEQYPDHKGAAEYIQGLGSRDDAILIAEDILQQTYYLGTVHYWLRDAGNSHQYSIIKDGQLVDQYTGAVTLGTGLELTEVLDASLGRELYIIGSGENFVDGTRLFRGRGIDDVLESDRLKVVFTGRDEKTKVWKLVR